MKKILIVEDDPAILKGLITVLTAADYQVNCENDGKAGYEKAKKLIPDLLILDVNLPKMTGFEICKSLKMEGYKFPIFIISSMADLNSRLTGLNYGADDYIPKPFNLDELHLKVRNALMRHQTLSDALNEYDTELIKAHEIQKNSLPVAPPQIPGIKIAAKLIPAKQMSGDYYDFLQLEDNRYAIVIADVMGEGLSAALYVQKMQGILHSNLQLIRTAKDVILLLQKYINLREGWFITASVVLIDEIPGDIYFARAGHPPVILKLNSGVDSLLSPGMMISNGSRTMLQKTLSEMKFKIRDIEGLLLYSDGVIECRNINEEEFGEERLKMIYAAAGNEPEEIINKIENEIKNFTGNKMQQDDVTIIAVEFSL